MFRQSVRTFVRFAHWDVRTYFLLALFLRPDVLTNEVSERPSSEGANVLTERVLKNLLTQLCPFTNKFSLFLTFIGSLLLGFTLPQAGAIGIIGGADGPTAIFLSSMLAPDLLGPILSKGLQRPALHRGPLDVRGGGALPG